VGKSSLKKGENKRGEGGGGCFFSMEKDPELMSGRGKGERGRERWSGRKKWGGFDDAWGRKKGGNRESGGKRKKKECKKAFRRGRRSFCPLTISQRERKERIGKLKKRGSRMFGQRGGGEKGCRFKATVVKKRRKKVIGRGEREGRGLSASSPQREKREKRDPYLSQGGREGRRNDFREKKTDGCSRLHFDQRRGRGERKNAHFVIYRNREGKDA